MKVLEPFTSLDFDLHEIMQYKYIRTRFGKINVDYYHRLEKALLEDIDALFLEGSRDASYVYGVYFVSDADAGKVDSIMRSLHFEKSICWKTLAEPRWKLTGAWIKKSRI